MANFTGGTEKDLSNLLDVMFLKESESNPIFKQLVKILSENVRLEIDNLLQNQLYPASAKLISIIEKSFRFLVEKNIEISKLPYIKSLESETCLFGYYSEIELIINEIEEQLSREFVLLEDTPNNSISNALTRIPKYPFSVGDENLIYFNLENSEVIGDAFGNDFSTRYSDFVFKLRQNLPNAIYKTIINNLKSFYSEYFKTIACLKHTFKLSAFCFPKTDSEIFDCFKSGQFTYNSEIFINKCNIELNGIKERFNILISDQKIISDFSILLHQADLSDGSLANINSTGNPTNALTDYNSDINRLRIKLECISKLLFNEFRLEWFIDKINLQFYWILQQLYFEINQFIINVLGNKNDKLGHEINTAIDYHTNKNLNIDSLFSSNEKLSVNLIKDVEDSTQKYILQLKSLINTIPEKSNLAKDFDYFSLNIDDSNETSVTKILSNKIIEDNVSCNLIEPLNQKVGELSTVLNEIDTNIINQINLIKHSIFKQDINKKLSLIESDNIDSLDFLAQKLLETQINKRKIDELGVDAFKELAKSLNIVQDRLNINYLKAQANNFMQYIPKRQTLKALSKLNKFCAFALNYYDKFVRKFWAHQSKAKIIAEEVLSKQKYKSTLNGLLNSIESKVLSVKANSQLPFYYRQLFLNKAIYTNEFWIGRPNEIAKAQTAYNRFKSGLSGGLMVTGEHFSGKSFFVNYSCSEILKPARLIFIDAPESGIIDAKLLLKKFQEKTSIKGDLSKILTNLDNGTIVVFDDLELWWEKSENGFLILKQIVEIMEQFGDKIFFIVTISSPSLLVIDKTIKLKNLFLDIIYCKPVNSTILHDIILLRHKLSGLKFSFIPYNSLGRKRVEESFKSRNFAKLFSKYYNYSNGNIGICILAWMSNIVEFKDKRLMMKLPEMEEIDELNDFSKDEILLLYNLFIHKKMDIEKLSRVLLLPEIEVHNLLALFQKSNIITKGPIYEINPFIDHIVSKFLRKQNML